MVVALYLVLKRQSDPSINYPATIKSMLGIWWPSSNKNPNDARVISNPSNSNTVVGQPANPLDELEALAEPIQEPEVVEPFPVVEPAPQPVQEPQNGTDTTDDGLTPLQRAIKAKNEAVGINQ